MAATDRVRRTFRMAATMFFGVACCVSFEHRLAAQEKTPPATVAADASVESLFTDFLHYARVGHFTAADAFARALLAHPQLDPVKVQQAANRDPKSLQTLLTLIKNSSIGENAAKVLDLVEQGEHLRRQDPVLIRENIQRLGGDPQQELYAIQHLKESGEYAVPPMVATLLDPASSRLWPRVVQALPKMGRSAVGPMVTALAVRNDDVRLNLIHALGEIGYPQAIPYLLAVASEERSPPEVKQAAWKAVGRIEVIGGRNFPGSPEEHFLRLGNQYFEENDAVAADPRLESANVWSWDDSAQALTAIVVPTRLFGPVMAMRCAEQALQPRNDFAEAIALWLGANIRREARLGLNVESRDPAEKGEPDPTRPRDFPRALYFTQASGPRYAQMVLEQAIQNRDAMIALGAIEALRATAGEASLLQGEFGQPPLAKALQFPDLTVRIRAALALGAALPRSSFADSHLVVPTLAVALGLSGREQVLVVDPDPANLNRVAGALRSGGREVIADVNFHKALDRARREFSSTTGIFLSADLKDPPLGAALAAIRGEYLFAMTPVVVLYRPQQQVMIEELAQLDRLAEMVDSAADPAAILDALSRARSRAGAGAIDLPRARSMALTAAETLRRIAADGRTSYQVEVAEPALIAALASTDEELQTRSASVLALLPTPTAQRSVAHLALDSGQSRPLRIAAFHSLSESARNFGLLLEEGQVAELVRLARDEQDLTLRTAAAEALGAVNLSDNQASAIIRAHRGS